MNPAGIASCEGAPIVGSFAGQGPLYQAYSTGPIPPVAGVTLTISLGSNGPQFDWSSAISPPSVTLQHGTTSTPTLSSAIQPFPSVTLTVYVPASRLSIVAVDSPLACAEPVEVLQA